MERKTFLHKNCNILKNVRISEEDFNRILDGDNEEFTLDLTKGRNRAKVASWREYAAARRAARRMENVVEFDVGGFKHYFLFSYNFADFIMDVKDINNGKENPCDALRMKILARVSFA